MAGLGIKGIICLLIERNDFAMRRNPFLPKHSGEPCCSDLLSRSKIVCHEGRICSASPADTSCIVTGTNGMVSETRRKSLFFSFLLYHLLPYSAPSLWAIFSKPFRSHTESAAPVCSVLL